MVSIISSMGKMSIDLEWCKEQKEAGFKLLVAYTPVTWDMVPSKFFKSFVELTSESVKQELLEKYNVKLTTFISNRFGIAENRNEAFDVMVNHAQADFVMSLDADQTFPKRTIPMLMEHISDEFQLVSGIYFRKSFPHKCVQGIYTPGWTKERELRRKSFEAMGFVDKDGNQTLFYKSLLDFTTIQKIDVSGMGVLLIDTNAIKRIEQPFFRYTNPYVADMDFGFEFSSEEMLFHSKLNHAGVKTLCVPSVRCGHLVQREIGCPEQ